MIGDKVKATLRELPDKPGCYLMRDRRGTIIYVGKAASLRKRVQSYFRDSTLRRGDPKLRGLIRGVADLEFIVLRSEAEAIVTEGRLIKDYQPRYNVLFKDDKRFPLLRVDVNHPLPRFQVCRLERDDGALYFGPYAGSAVARVAQDFVERTFGLRRCPPPAPDIETHHHCHDDILRFCSAPCVGAVTPEDYRARVEEACAFLRGERPARLEALATEMTRAAEALDFERAAALRDTLGALRTAIRQRALTPRPPALKAAEALAGLCSLRDLLGLPAAPRRIEAFDISNISGTHAVAGMVVALDGLPHASHYRRFRIKTIQAIDDPGMMAEVVRRRYTRLREEGGGLPGLVLVDGGPTQLHAAQAVLRELGLTALQVAGLAKRFEEIVIDRGAGPETIRLPLAAPALLVLRRLRDEAHRFALAYHLRLRERRIRESVLDDVPGVGNRLKQRLLKQFGSVTRLARAPAADIAAVPGVGAALAARIIAVAGKAQNVPAS